MVVQPTKHSSQSEPQVSHMTYHNWQWWTHVQAIDNAIIVSQKDYCWMSSDQIFVHVTRFRFPLRRLFMGNHRQHFQLRLRYWSIVQFNLCSACSTLLKINIYIWNIIAIKKAILITHTQKIPSVKHTTFIKDHGAHGNAVATCDR
jgi:hypothetical protein